MPIIATYNEDQPSELEKRLLISLVFTSTLKWDEREAMMEKIWNCTNYKEFEIMMYRLEDLQQNIHQIPNPSQKNINQHLLRIV